MKTRYIAVAVVILALLATSPVYLLFGNNQIRQTSSEAYWRALAVQAWEFFAPGKGVNPESGLHGCSLGYNYFTEWDLGTYIQAMIDASELGILKDDGEYGFNFRIEKILSWLKTRNLTKNGLPYLWYDAVTGDHVGDEESFAIDEGKLYLALYNLKTLKPSLAPDVDNIVKFRNNNTALIPNPDSWLKSTDVYGYYVAHAFKAFGFEGWENVPSSIINTIVSQPNVTVYGVELPTAHVCNEPMLLTFFEIGPQDSRFDWLLSQVNMAQEARYEATGHYTAFSEGNTALDNPAYVYEYVVDSDGNTFKVAPATTPIAYLKIAVGFNAIFNTVYTRDEVEYIMGKLPFVTFGFQDGVAEDGRVVNTTIDRTNGLIIAAAKYVIKNGKFDKLFWMNYNLDFFPHPFVKIRAESNVSVVVGESQNHGLVGAAETLDNLGGMLIAESLARESSNVTLKAAVDTWLVEYDSASGQVALLDNTTNLIVIGSPRINILSYYFNNLRNNLGESLVPVQYVQYESSDGSDSYLYVPASGAIYKKEVNVTDNTVVDYAVIMGFQDQPDRYVIMVFGLGSEATLGACQILKEYDQWSLRGSAVILKFSIDQPGNYPTNSSIVEVVP